jgi:hypothetical protein
MWLSSKTITRTNLGFEGVPMKNPECNNADVWGPCDCCGQYFCHGQPHTEDCSIIYDPEDVITWRNKT